jgi:5-methylcytosine-specific restriction enzyme A
MSWSPPKPCPYHGCNTLVSGGGRCPKHRQLTFKRPAFTDERPSASKRGYDGKWAKARGVFLAMHPTCRCGNKATVVDHIVAAKGDYELFWDRNNWQALCVACHNRKTNRYDGGLGNRVKAVNYGR